MPRANRIGERHTARSVEDLAHVGARIAEVLRKTCGACPFTASKAIAQITRKPPLKFGGGELVIPTIAVRRGRASRHANVDVGGPVLAAGNANPAHEPDQLGDERDAREAQRDYLNEALSDRLHTPSSGRLPSEASADGGRPLSGMTRERGRSL